MRCRGSWFLSSRAGRAVRRVAAAVSALSLFGAVVAVGAPAALAAPATPGTVTWSVTPDPATAAVGNQATLTVQATVSGSTYGMGSFTLDVTVDVNDVTVVNCASGSPAGVGVTKNCYPVPGQVNFTWANPSGLQNGGPVTVGTITVQSRNVAAGTTSPVTLTSVTATDTQGATMSAVENDGQVDIPAVLSSISGSPLSGPVTGGTQMTITGTGLAGATAVDFGANAGTILSDTPTAIEVVSPPSTTGPGNVNLTVVTLAGTSNALTWTYVAGYTSSTGVWIAPQTQAIPPGGKATVSVMALAPAPANLGDWTIGVTYNNSILTNPSCTSLAGTPGGPCAVTNNGNGTSTVNFDGSDASGLSGTNALEAIAFTGGTAGTSQITLSVATFDDTNGNQITPYSVTDGSVTVNSAPTISGVTPAEGWPGGGSSGDGTPVKITGTNFSGPTVTIGGQTATIVGTPTATSIVADVPADAVHAVGDVNGDGSVNAVDALCVLRAVVGLPTAGSACSATTTDPVSVTVTNGDGQSVTWTGQYTYNRTDVSSSDGGTATSLDALCVLRLVVGLPPTGSCPA